MTFSDADIQKTAHLARLTLAPEEAGHLTQQLAKILDFIDTINEVDTDNVPPIAHAQERPLTLRPDSVTETNQRDAFQAIAPAVEAGLYLVPKVIESA